MLRRDKVFRPTVSEILEVRAVPSGAASTVEVASLHTIGGFARGRLAAHDLLREFFGDATLTESVGIADAPALFAIQGVTSGGATLSASLVLGGFLPYGSAQTSGHMVLSDARGSITLDVQGRSNILASSTPPTLFYRIVGSTGIYRGAIGTGDAVMTAQLTGPIHDTYDPTGQSPIHPVNAPARFHLSFQPDLIPARRPTTVPPALAGLYAGTSQSTRTGVGGIGVPATLVTLDGGLLRPHPGFATLSGTIQVPDPTAAAGATLVASGTIVLGDRDSALTISLERISGQGSSASDASGVYRVTIVSGTGRYAGATGTGLARLAMSADGSFRLALRGTLGRRD